MPIQCKLTAAARPGNLRRSSSSHWENGRRRYRMLDREPAQARLSSLAQTAQVSVRTSLPSSSRLEHRWSCRRLSYQILGLFIISWSFSFGVWCALQIFSGHFWSWLVKKMKDICETRRKMSLQVHAHFGDTPEAWLQLVSNTWCVNCIACCLRELNQGSGLSRHH